MSFDTKLDAGGEQQYRQWMTAIGHTKVAGFNIDNNFSGTDYDYRGHYKKYGPVDMRSGGHFTDEFKKPNHPTFSVESVYSKAGQQGGAWRGGEFAPSSFNMMVKSAKETIRK